MHPTSSNSSSGSVSSSEDLPVVLVREDMDALSMRDEVNADYRSKKPGVAHKCGHDVHVATLIGAARMLAAARDTFHGEVRLVFQPGEETTGGALPMIAEGVARGIDAALSLHVMAYNRVGTIAVREGFITASEDDFHVTILGRGGHASNPHLAVNPVTVACAIVTNLQNYLSRTVCPLKHVVLTISHINSGSPNAVNVIPSDCKFSATLRTFDPEVRHMLQQGIPEFIRQMAQTFNTEAEVTNRKGFCAGENHRFVVDAVRKATTMLYGEDALLDIPDPEMGSEDFYYFSLGGTVPACQYWLGGANPERGITADNHHPGFDVDEDCLAMGAASLAAISVLLLDKIAKEGKKSHHKHHSHHGTASPIAGKSAYANVSLVHDVPH